MAKTGDFPASTAFLEEVDQSVKKAIEDLDLRIQKFGQSFLNIPTAHREVAWNQALAKIDADLKGWTAILSTVSDRVRTAQEDLLTHEDELRSALKSMDTSRRHLQARAA